MIGRVFSHYRVIQHIGGGMGVVYMAGYSRLKRTAGLKFLPPELSRDPDTKERFVHEAQLASALQHNNICAGYDTCETGDTAESLHKGSRFKYNLPDPFRIPPPHARVVPGRSFHILAPPVSTVRVTHIPGPGYARVHRLE